ncbi:MAG: S-layer homology domain-containing protein [Clostridia bacterium]|nr:S-layer homology domain-containing protein [Clostridia bacterium]
MKKLISIILSAVMLFTTVITVNAASFKDVKSSDWFYSSVNYVSDKGIMNGTSTTKFSPNKSLTRAMGVTLLYRVAGSPSVSGITLPFTDVKGGQWYTDAVKWAYKNGIVNGKSNTYFDTNANITRAEFVTILYRYTAYAGLTVPITNRGNYPTDLADIPKWAIRAVTDMCLGEVITGRSDRSFDPNANITRAETAAVIERYTKKAVKYVPGTDPENTIKVEEIPTTGQLVVKEKKYDYKGVNVMIMNIENQTDKNLTLTISAKYLNSNGGVIKTETRKVEGVPANYRYYVVLQPGIKFDKFTYEVKTESFSGTAYAKYLTWDSKTTATRWACPLKPGGGSYPDGQERAAVLFEVRHNCSYNVPLCVHYDEVFFDKNGEIYHIGKIYTTLSDYGEKHRPCTFHDILYKDFTFPEELKGDLKVILAPTYVGLEIK